MEKLRRLFFETDMSWRRVAVLSVLCGVIPGLLMIPEFLSGSSLQQPGISFEFWIFMAMLIILNCEKPLEAGLKTFVFFLISQPLIYLVQVPFCMWHWGIFRYYPEWGVITLFTLPGGMIAWHTKKGNALSVLILSVADLILCAELPYSAIGCVSDFPKLLLTALFILFQLVLYPVLLFREKKLRVAAYAASAVMLVLSAALQWNSLTTAQVAASTVLEGEEPYEIVSEYDGLTVTVNGELLTVTTEEQGSWQITVRDGDGNEITYLFENEDGTSVFYPLTETP